MAANPVNMSVDDLRALVREMVLEILSDLTDQTDPDAGLTFKPEVADYLRRYRQERPQGTPLQDVLEELGLDA